MFTPLTTAWAGGASIISLLSCQLTATSSPQDLVLLLLQDKSFPLQRVTQRFREHLKRSVCGKMMKQESSEKPLDFSSSKGSALLGHLPCSLWLLALALWTHNSPAAQTLSAASFQRPFCACPTQTAAGIGGGAVSTTTRACSEATKRSSVLKKALPDSP